MAHLSAERDVIQLFKMQFLVERELRRISKGRVPRRKQGIGVAALIDELRAAGSLSAVFARIAKKLMAIAPRTAARKPLRVNETRLVRNVAPDALQVLRMFPTRR